MSDMFQFSAQRIEADAESRTISGLIVPFDSVGNASVGGAVKFERGSLDTSQPVKLLLEHERRRPIGKMIEATETDEGIFARFKIATTNAGTDGLIEAAEGLRDGLSVGAIVDAYTVDPDGTKRVTAARLAEVSLVTDPAFSEARVTKVAASESEESDEVIEEQSETVEGTDTMENPTPEVEASKVEAAAAPIFTAPRVAPLSGAQYLEASIKASLGDDEARMMVRAADDDTTTNTGLTLAPHMSEFITSSIGSRPAFDAVRREALPESGLSFTIPRLTAVPTVADTNEGSAPSETGMTSDYLTVNVNKFAGMNTVSWELIDRSSPAFMTELMRELQNAYALATDKALIAAFTASGTAATGVAATAAGLQSFVATESAAAYKNSGKFARNLVASPDQWAAIMGYADSTGRPLYIAAQPQNAAGAVANSNVRGNVLGLDFFVDHGITTSGIVDESAFIIAPDAVSVYESARTQVSVNVIGSGQIEVALYGYLAIAIKQAAGVRRWNTV